MNKLLGYILALVGLLGVAAYTVPQVREALPLPEIGDTVLIIVSVALIILGVFFILKTGGGAKQAREVPIFKGKNIVGYRRR